MILSFARKFLDRFKSTGESVMISLPPVVYNRLKEIGADPKRTRCLRYFVFYRERGWRCCLAGA